MIRRSLLLFAILVVGYMAFIHFVKVDFDTSQHQFGGNRIKAEQFLFSADDPNALVIIGSSLSYRIKLDSLPKGTVNLGFGGLSIYEGLQLMGRSGKKPSRVIIETNLLFREPDQAFLDGVFQPGLYEIRRATPILREENQPTGIVFGWLKRRLKLARGPVEAIGDTMAMSKTLFDANMADFAALPADSIQERFLAKLNKGVKELEDRGIEVIFMEVPIAPELMVSPLAVHSRALIQERFSKNRFIRTDPSLQWRTTDGLHLEQRNAQRYSGWLAGELRSAGH